MGYAVIAAVAVLATAAYALGRRLVLRIEDRLDELSKIAQKAAVDASNAHVRCDGITARLSHAVDRIDALKTRVDCVEQEIQ